MVKSAYLKDCLRQVVKTINRFMAILVITILGVAFYAGLRSSGPDMQVTASAYYDELDFMDIRILSEVGFNEEDVEAISAVEGVVSVSPGYSADVLADLELYTIAVRLHSLPVAGDLNKPELLEGRMPQKSGECLADSQFVKITQKKIGDTVDFASGDSNPLSDSLKTESYTITGIMTSPLYISIEYGSNSVGSGRTDGLFYLLPEDFAYEVYTEVYLTADISGVSRFDDLYTSLLAPVRSALEKAGLQRCRIRYNEILSEGRKELADARQKVADGYAELADAEQELIDARKEIDDGWKEYYSGVRQYQNRMASGEAQLAEAQRQIDDGRSALAAGRKQYEEEIAKAQQLLDDGQKQYDDGLAQYEEGLALYQQGEAELTAAQQEADQARQLLDLAWTVYNQAAEWDAQIESALGAGDRETVIALLEEATQSLADLDPRLAEYRDQALAYINDPEQWEQIEQALAQIPSILAEVKTQLDEQQRQLDDGQRQLDEGWAQLAQSKAQLDAAKATLDESKKALDDGRAELEQKKADAQQQFADAEQQLADAQRQVDEGRAALESGKRTGILTLDDAKTQLLAAEREYKEGKAEFDAKKEDALKELADAEEEIAKNQKTLDEFEMPKWYVLDIETNVGFVSYKQDSQRVETIAYVIPALFFLVAVLVTMTSMTRLVDTDRSYIGTLKALGYSNIKISLRYMLYAVSASLLGSFIGLLVGYNLFPRIVFDAYLNIYMLPPVIIVMDLESTVVSITIAVCCAAIPAFLVCLRSLREAPASLMRPVAPKVGRRTLIERIPFLWRQFNFSWKVSLRNMFRYRKRLFMTLFGVAGCTALMFTGFGLRDSITTVVSRQYGNLRIFDLEIAVSNDITGSDFAAVQNFLRGEDVEQMTFMHQESVDVITGTAQRSVYLCVPHNPDGLSEYIRIQDRVTAEPVALSGSGIVITEKLADLSGLSVGDTMTLRDADNRDYQVTIDALCENYVSHYIYLSETVYEKVFGKEAKLNRILCNLSDNSQEAHAALSGTLLEEYDVTYVSFSSDLQASAEKMLDALNMVILVLIISAAALVFVVLFSLTSIGLEERGRELSTIKVLGFFDHELALYIYRENGLLTVIGTFIGLGLGVLLQRYVISTMEIDILMFSRDLLWQSYVYSCVLTFFFAALVDLFMMKSIRKIDMVASLKSIE